ncbi:MAG TPA: glycoside hydrolase family 3 N-terminal domain-containing protein, partial [Nakamurella sp.]
LPCFDGITAPDWIRRRVAAGLGGICLFARNVGPDATLADLTASLHAERDGVIIAIDEEAGDVTRIDAATGSRFPGAAALGRVDDVALTALIARQVGTVLADVGVTVNFAPCADVAVDPANPVIGSRSFGGDVALVARHTAAWVTGQQAAVAACAKHFPGHGDTVADTHLTLAVLTGTPEEVWEQALPPFRSAIEAGVSAIMAGHLLVPAVDDLPASVSRRWLAGVLRGELGFSGAIVSDALEMAALRDSYGIPGAAVMALVAGTDLLCIGGDPMPESALDAIRDAIVTAVRDGVLPAERLADAALRAATLGRRPSSPSPHSPDSLGGSAAAGAFDPGPSASAAERAIQVAGTVPTLPPPTLVLRCEERPNIAVGAIPWGLLPALPADLRPIEIVLHDGDPLPATAVQEAGSVIIVTRDRHRHPWMVGLLAAARTLRPDAVLVEMGISGVDIADAPALASFGAGAANAGAVVRLMVAAPSR